MRRRWRWVKPATIAGFVFLAAAVGPAQSDDRQQATDRAATLYQQGHYTAAASDAEKAVSLTESSFGASDPRVASSLDLLARVYDRQGKFREAETQCRRALAIRNQAPGNGRLDLAESLNTLGQIERHQAHYPAAQSLYLQALRIRQQALGPAHPEVAAVRNNLGRLYFSLGDYAKAQHEYETALRLREKKAGSQQLDVAQSLNDLAELHESLRDYEAAEPLYKRALEIREHDLGDAHPDVAQTLTNLANLYRHQGRYGVAEPLAQRALAIDEQALGSEHPYVATDLNNLAVIAMKQGHYATAEEFYQRALGIREKALGPDHPEVAQTLNDLADLYRHTKRYALDEQMYERALRIDEKALGPNHRYVGTVLNNLARVHAEQGDLGQARTLAERALHIHEQALGRDSGPVAIDLTDLAAIEMQQGKPKNAELPLLRARSNWERLAATGNEDHLISVLMLLGTLYANLQQPRKAQEQFARAFDLTFDQFRAYFRFGSEKDRLEFVNRNADRVPVYLSFVEMTHEKQPELAGSAYDLLLWEKGLVANSMEALNRQVAASGDELSLELLKQFLLKRAQIAALLNMGMESHAQQRALVTKLKLEANNLERKLAQRSAVYAQHENLQRKTWQQVKAALRPDDAAVEFVRYLFFDRTKLTSDTHYLAFVLRGTSASPAIVALGNHEPVAHSYDVKEFDPFWKPLEAALTGVQRLYLAPDGVLNQIPLGLIHLDDGRLLMEKYDLYVLSSTKDLLRERHPVADRRAVLVGNPAFDLNETLEHAALAKLSGTEVPEDFNPSPSTRSAEMTETALDPLPGTAVEIQRVQSLLQQWQWQVTSYTNDLALEEVIKQLRHPRLLHVATHGFFLADRSVSGQPGSRDEDPMLRSGLYFAGADRALAGRAPPSGMDDGVLTAYEATALDLQGTELVVLSACETGRGEVRNGEGVFGLWRALQESGAEAIMMSFWSVPDQESQELMTLFYSKWLGGMDKHQALREAQLEMRQRVKERYGGDLPYYWAAFVMVGL